MDRDVSTRTFPADVAAKPSAVSERDPDAMKLVCRKATGGKVSNWQKLEGRSRKAADNEWKAC